MHIRFFSSFLILFIFYSSLVAQEIDLEAGAGNNIGRLEEDDGDEVRERNDQLGRIGPVEFPVRFDQAGVATMALYTPGGRLVRILAQVLPVEAREYRLRWDGLDLFGHPVPAGTDLEIKTIFNPGVTASYEMAASAPRVAPWPGSFERDGQSRAGGWMGDHSAPNSIAWVGDRLLLGTMLAEAGDNLAALTPNGEKIWGAKLQGWDGPAEISSEGRQAAVLNRRRNTVFHVNPEMKKDSVGLERLDATKIFSGSTIRHIAVHDDELLVISDNPVARVDPARHAFSSRVIDFSASRPQVLGTEAPTEFMISPQAAFGNIFNYAGNRQNGVRMVAHEGAAYVMLVLKEDVRLGSVLLPEIKDVSRFEVFTLKSGNAFNEFDSPFTSKGGEVMMVSLEDEGENWVPFGQSDLKQPLNWISAENDPVTTRAILLKALPVGKSETNWRPFLGMARMFAEPIREVTAASPTLTSPTLTRTFSPEGSGWEIRSAYPISVVYPLQVVADFGGSRRFNALAVYNATHPELRVDVLRAGVDPARASEEDWSEVGLIRGNHNRKQVMAPRAVIIMNAWYLLTAKLRRGQYVSA
jgi:hypothetical protein